MCSKRRSSGTLAAMIMTIGRSIYWAAFMVAVTTATKGSSTPDFTVEFERAQQQQQQVRRGPRRVRFPSKEERLKVYLGNWYLPPCSNAAAVTEYEWRFESTDSAWPQLAITDTSLPTNHDSNGDDDRHNLTKSYLIQSIVDADQLFVMDASVVRDCAWEQSRNATLDQRVKFRLNMHMYCEDVADTLVRALTHVQFEHGLEKSDNVPTLLQFGDLKHSHGFHFVNIPHIKKFRSSTTREGIAAVTNGPECVATPTDRALLPNAHALSVMQPIIWKLASSRHYRLLDQVYRDDTAWEHKVNMAVFRGQLTGSRNDGYDRNASDEANCLVMRRCRLVYTHANSSYVHARLTSTRRKVPATLNGVKMLGPAVTMRKLLQYKGIIMLEGNDVASGLKWALLSASIVLMPPPQHTSWALEELLRPWVHYVPLNDNATDVEAKMQWVVEHDAAARQIARQGSLWMEDLVYHPDAAGDDAWIQEETMRRYQKHFRRRKQSSDAMTAGR